jgi:hypothetical protein
MSATEGEPGWRRVAGGLRAVVWGRTDTRVRATYRVLLAMPVFWFLAGGLAGTIQSLTPIPPGGELGGGVGFSLLHAGLFLLVFLPWARFLDRRPLSNYGISRSSEWVLNAVVGFGAVLVGFGVWYGLGSTLGWTTISVSLSAPNAPLALALAMLFVALAIHVALQQLVFVSITVQNAAEGLASRGLSPRRAVLGAWAVATLVFVLMHRPAELGGALNLVVSLGAFGLLYVQTGDLALPIGVHLGVNYGGSVVFTAASRTAESASVFAVSQLLSGIPASLSRGAIPQIMVAYLLVLAWVTFRGRDGAVTTELATWTGRPTD